MSTHKQEEYFNRSVKNGVKKCEAALDATYSPSKARNPQDIESTKGFRELMEKYLPDEKLQKKHDELLNHKKPEINIKALDMAYKLKNRYGQEGGTTINILNQYLRERGV